MNNPAMKTLYKRIALSVAASLTALLLTACVTEPAPQQLDHDLRQSSVVSTSDPNFQPQPGETVAWGGDIAVHRPDGTEVDPAIINTIVSNINTNLKNKGYRFAPQGAQPDYWIQGILVLGNQLNETQLRDVLGFEPGLVAHNQDYQKGSLLLLLVDPNTRSTDWRAVVQVFTAQELPEDVRKQRLEYIIRSLLRPLPTLSQPASN